MSVVLNTIWILIATILVFFMQAGFAMVETGFTRAKNAGNIIMKNLMDFSVGSLMFWMIGSSLMFGDSIMGIIGKVQLFSVPKDYAFLIFQTVFCATAATIVSGAMAERTKFISYLIFSFFISVVIYPVVGHWIWGGGWLSQLGFHDFAGSTVVHGVGGFCALVGAKIIGPRIGKYSKGGKVNTIPGHSITLGALGVFILWFGWFGFNPGSQLAASTESDVKAISLIFFNTNIAASVSAISAMIIAWFRKGKADVGITLNGVLGGLVAITAGCAVVSPVGAMCIGFIASFIVVYGREFVEKILRIDDPVDAVTVHGLCGVFGTIAVGIFSTSEAIGKGILYGGTGHLLGIQLIGAGAVVFWVLLSSTVLFKAVDLVFGLRVSKKEELLGLDAQEHGIDSYADFQMKEYGEELSLS